MHLRSGRELVEDREGLTFGSLDEAIVAATKAARDIMSADVRAGTWTWRSKSRSEAQTSRRPPSASPRS